MKILQTYQLSTDKINQFAYKLYRGYGQMYYVIGMWHMKLTWNGIFATAISSVWPAGLWGRVVRALCFKSHGLSPLVRTWPHHFTWAHKTKQNKKRKLSPEPARYSNQNMILYFEAKLTKIKGMVEQILTNFAKLKFSIISWVSSSHITAFCQKDFFKSWKTANF